MKRILSLILALCMLLALAACGGSEDAPAGTDGNKADGGSKGGTFMAGLAWWISRPRILFPWPATVMTV